LSSTKKIVYEIADVDIDTDIDLNSSQAALTFSLYGATLGCSAPMNSPLFSGRQCYAYTDQTGPIQTRGKRQQKEQKKRRILQACI